MELDLLTAISPIDGRYRGKAGALASYFSEFALIKYRVQVEIEYFITLCELPLPQLKTLDVARFESLRDIYRNFTESDAARIKEIESVTNHDVKAAAGDTAWTNMVYSADVTLGDGSGNAAAGYGIEAGFFAGWQNAETFFHEKSSFHFSRGKMQNYVKIAWNDYTTILWCFQIFLS